MYDIHDPKYMKRLYQLRVGLNPLIYHKKRHNLKDTSSDACRCEMSVETTKHFLVYCDLYRNNLFLAINPLLVENDLNLSNDTLLVEFLLYGDDTFSVEDNTAVPTVTLNYIDKSAQTSSYMTKSTVFSKITHIEIKQ